jgi:hypothetical protein
METNSGTPARGSPPPELTGSLPRRIRPSPGSRYGEIVIAIMLVLTCVLTIWISRSALQKMQQTSALRQSGAEVRGEIGQIESVPRSMDRVSYTFEVDGKTFSGNAGVPARLAPALRQSNVLAVRYLPSNPDVNHPAAWEWPLMPSIAGMICLAILTFTFITFAVIICRRRQLVARGEPAVASVTGCSPGKTSYLLKYEFHTDTQSSKGEGWSSTRREIGAKIWVLYLPGNLNRNHPYPFPDYSVEK